MSKRTFSKPLAAVALTSALLAVSASVNPLDAMEHGSDRQVAIEAAAGDYEFDLTEAGAGVLVLKFLAKDATLWVRTASSSEPHRLEPVAGRDNTFSMTDPEEGAFGIEFLDDQSGRFARAHLTNPTLGIDAVGNRLARSVHFPSLSERLADRDGRAETLDDLRGTRVAVYFGHGMDPHSALALGRAFQWMGCDVEMTDAAAIQRGALSDFDVLAIPGGEQDPDPWSELGHSGKSAIQSFVRGGGGYVGVCFGALFAARTADFWGDELGADDLYLDLLPGAAHCGQSAIAAKGSWPVMTDLVVSAQGREISGETPPRMRAVTYPNGPYFELVPTADVTIVSTFGATGEPAMVAFEYGSGKVFLSGPHPEIEVDSDRDGSSRFDELDDQGSEWPLLLAVTKWLTSE